MALMFDRSTYFGLVRDSLFSGKMTQQQTDGQEFLLDTWEDSYSEWDVRWLAYSLATTIHETASTMWPIEEYGKGKGQPYGEPDPVTGHTYYGRGDVQLTHKENYDKMTPIVDPMFPQQPIDLVKNPSLALDPPIAAAIMYEGMHRGVFRKDSKGKQTYARYFNATANDPYGAREIINGDKHIVPSWSNGVSIGKLIANYHNDFLDALVQASENMGVRPPDIALGPAEPQVVTLTIKVNAPPGVTVVIQQE